MAKKTVKKESKKVNFKMTLKNIIESPFSMKLPIIDKKFVTSIVALLKDLLISNKDENMLPKRLKKSEMFSEITIGFNAVMRKLEKNLVKLVLINADAKPNIILNSFAPICEIKKALVVPVPNLAKIIEKYAGFKSTLAIGFDGRIEQNENKFHVLYLECWNVLNKVSPSSAKVSENSNRSLNRGNSENKLEVLDFHDKTNSAKDDLRIESIYLKRPNKSTRIFKPNKSVKIYEKNMSKINIENDFIRLQSEEHDFIGLIDNSSNIEQSNTKKSFKNEKKRYWNSDQSNRTEKNTVNRNINFFVDDFDESKSKSETVSPSYILTTVKQLAVKTNVKNKINKT